MSATFKDKAGYLTKQGKTVKNWRRRWVVLKNNQLSYYKQKDESTPLDSIPLNDCTCCYASFYETKKRCCLKIITARRTWYFAADTDEEIGLWLEALFMWGVPESKEEEEVINSILEATHALQAVAVTVFQYSSAGPIDVFRDVCRTATVKGDAFTASFQIVTRYNSSIKYSPSQHFNDFLKEITIASSSIRDTFLALVTMATDARDSPNDNEVRRKLTGAATLLSEKIASFRKLLLDESKGLRTQLRTILYGKHRSCSQPTSSNNSPNVTPSSTPPSPVPIRNGSGSGLSGPIAITPAPIPVAAIPPLSIHSHINGNAPPSPTSPTGSISPPPSAFHAQASRSSSSPRGFGQSLSSSLPAQSSVDEQEGLFEDLIAYSKDFVQIMKNLRAIDLEAVSSLPRSGYVAAMLCVKAARDYANLHQHAAPRQAILASAGRVFVATNQLYNPLNNEEEYSTDELLKYLSQAVAAMVTTVLHHRNNPPPSPTLPPMAYSTSTGMNMNLNNSGSFTPPPHRTSSEQQLSLMQQHHNDHMIRSNSSSKIEVKKTVGIRHNSGGSSANANGRNAAEGNDAPTLITSTDGDVNIWDEAQDASNVVFIEDEGVSADGELPIRGGTLNQIVKRLTNENKPELRFVKAFIVTYPSFTTSDVFFNKLVQRYQVPVSVIEEGTLQMSDWKQQKLLPIQLRVYNVLKLWLEHRFHDFTPPLLAKLKLFMDECMRRDGHSKLADQLQNIITRKTSSEKQKTLNIPLPTLTKELFWKKYPGDFFINLDEEELAKQLTLIEFSTYRAIEPLEVLNQAWNKASLRHRSPNVMRMISRFNSISFWVARLLVNEERLRYRVKMMTKLIRFAQALYKENNLNSLLAVVSGLNNAAIHRLKFTMEELSNKDVESLAKFGSLLSSDMGYKNYRARVHTINPPLIPYLGIYLTDLTFIEEGNNDFVENKLINFKKREMIFNVISEIQQYQQEAYRYEINESLIAYLAELPVIEADPKALEREHKELYDLSLQREPRNANKADLNIQ